MDKMKTMLIVDDSRTNRAILKGIFKDLYMTLEAADGLEAVELVKKYEINVIILDLNMPHMDGFEFMDYMRRSSAYSNIPIVVNTQYGQEENEIKALAMGAQDFISKPYNIEIVQHRVRNVIVKEQLEEQILEAEMDKKLIRKMKDVIEKDALTGIYTREAFCKYTQDMLQMNPETDYVLMRLDVERFKIINDLFGTKVGDMVLNIIAQKLKKKLQGIGTYGRIAGDNFVCCFPEGTINMEDIGLQHDPDIEELQLKYDITLYYGVYRITDRSVSINLMCDRAEMVIRTIKGNYLKRIAYYDDELRMKMLEEQQLTNDMQSGLKNGEFCIFLQPIYDVNSDHITTAEALVRWNHATKGIISPGIFIPLFERNGLITKLDRYVWELACKSIRSSIDNGETVVPVSVNVSRINLFLPNLGEELVALLDQYHLEPHHLKLEITESAYTKDQKQLLDAIIKLKEKGFTIVMDDFGSGYSSLNVLKDMPIDVVKVDMSFINDVSTSRKADVIMMNMVRMAKEIGITVVVEGVETEDQLQYLKSINCDQIQGFLYSKPVPEAVFHSMEGKEAQE
ncbi:MAG: EAL domain-containing protein [Lachnospiraceae bacterium]